ncbi:MAG: twin-arginine translocase TatA/TatE family subunit [Syntrophales bacterium]|jgi:sec-independent protein translocase protein TatA
MFGMGMQELVIVLVIALIVFGPGKLPDLGSSVGKAIKDFKRSVAEPEEKPGELAEDKKNENKKG